MKKGSIEVHTQNIFPVIKKWLYSDKDIFLRELVVNGCDAITKMKKLVSLGEAEKSTDEEFSVSVKIDKDNSTITITDNGIGMTAEEVEKYITQLAFSGAEEFLEKYKSNDDKNTIVGHFGLGFYSAFMVSDVVEINTKSYKDEKAVNWKCDGGTEYEMNECQKETRGTEIILHVTEAEKEFLEPFRLKSILLKYCGFLPYPIFLNDEKEPVNDTKPLWTLNPSECTDEQYKELYHRVFSDINDPLFWIHLNVEYPFELKGILYFPKLTHEFESAEGKIKLYNNQVFVADNIKEVIPEFLMLLKGMLDCPEMPLNVSRSALQNDGYVKKISSHITKKVADKLLSLHKDEKSQFEKYYNDISAFIEYGCLRDEKFYDKIKDILMAETTDDKFVEIKDYAEKNNKEITYVTDTALQAQYIKIFKNEGKEALIMPHVIDTHFISYLEMKESYKFTRIDAIPNSTELDEDAVNIFKTCLNNDDITITSSHLKTSVPALIAENEQERRMNDMQKMFGNAFKTEQKETLVINSDSEMIKKLKNVTDEVKKKMLCKQIYDMARLCHRPLSVEEMSDYVERSTKLLEMLAD